MKRYIALLRAINVSGKNMIPMADLKTGFEETGYRNVKTLLNSGNVVFDAEERPEPVLAEALSSMIRDRYALDVPVFVILREDLRALLKKAPSWWGADDKAVYDNLIFLLHGSDAGEIALKIGEPTEGLEKIEICGGAVFWSFLLGRHSKANWWKKTAMPGIGEHLTIRTAGTCRKLAGL